MFLALHASFPQCAILAFKRQNAACFWRSTLDPCSVLALNASQGALAGRSTPNLVKELVFNANKGMHNGRSTPKEEQRPGLELKDGGPGAEDGRSTFTRGREFKFPSLLGPVGPIESPPTH